MSINTSIELIDAAAEAEVNNDQVMQVLNGPEILGVLVRAAQSGDDMDATLELVKGMVEQITREAFITGFRRGHVNGLSEAVNNCEEWVVNEND